MHEIRLNSVVGSPYSQKLYGYSSDQFSSSYFGTYEKSGKPSQPLIPHPLVDRKYIRSLIIHPDQKTATGIVTARNGKGEWLIRINLESGEMSVDEKYHTLDVFVGKTNHTWISSYQHPYVSPRIPYIPATRLPGGSIIPTSDGNCILSEDRGPTVSLWNPSGKKLSEHPLSKNPNFHRVTPTRDAKKFAYQKDGKLFVSTPELLLANQLPKEGLDLRTLLRKQKDDPYVCNLTWSPDGQELAGYLRTGGYGGKIVQFSCRDLQLSLRESCKDLPSGSDHIPMLSYLHDNTLVRSLGTDLQFIPPQHKVKVMEMDF